MVVGAISGFEMHGKIVTKEGEVMKLRYVFLYSAVVSIAVVSSKIAWAQSPHNRLYNHHRARSLHAEERYHCH